MSFLREQRREGERSHEELVAIIRKDVAEYIERKAPYITYRLDPVALTREWLVCGLTGVELTEAMYRDRTLEEEMPHAQLLLAWDLIASQYYRDALSLSRSELGKSRAMSRNRCTITLDVNEGKLLSAMAEAVGIPNPFGVKPPEKK